MSLVYCIFGVALLSLVCIGESEAIYDTNSAIQRDVKSLYLTKKVFVYILFCTMFSILMGFRYNFVDTSTYKLMFNRIGTDFSNLLDPKVSVIEVGFNIWMILCNIVLKSSDQLFVFITTAITLIFVLIFIYKESEYGGLSIFLFVTLYSFTFMNGIRQSLTAAIFAILYRKHKDNIVIMVLICCALSLLHNSMLFVMALYICSRGKFCNWKMKALILCGLLCVVAPNSIEWIFNLVLSERYFESLAESDYGTGIMRIIVNSIPAILMLLARHITGSDDYGQNDSLDNLLIIDLIVNFCSIRSTYFARMSIYFGLFLCVYYPTLIKRVFNERSQRYAVCLVVVFYTTFYIFQVLAYKNYGYLNGFYLNFSLG